jgi:hypothetical protein
MAHDPLEWIDAALAEWEQQGLRRRPISHDGAQGATITVGGRTLINFGSNDYLGLANDPRLARAARESLDREGFGAGASPLVTGHAASHRRLEQQLAEFEGTEAALLFPTGFAANAGTIAALVGAGDAVFSDAKNHASLIDGCRLSRAEVHIYPHGDVGALRELLHDAGRCRRRLIVTDSLFSMDGDLAPLCGLADLAEQLDAMLMVDEAHATGVFGEQGRGVALALRQERSGCRKRADARIVEFQFRQRPRTIAAAGNEHPPIAEQRRGVLAARRAHGNERGERARGGIKELDSTDGLAGDPIPPYEQDHAVIEEGSRMAPDGRRQRCRNWREKPRGGIVEFCRGQCVALGIFATCDQDLAVWQQRHRVPSASLRHIGCRLPGSRRLRQ